MKPMLVAALAGAPLPARRIDGHDIRALIYREPGARSPWDDEGFGYYRREQLQAVRSGRWKLYLPLTGRINNAGKASPRPTPPELYDVIGDVHEDHEASAQHPEVVTRLLGLAGRIRAEIGDLGRPGKGQRPAGHVERAKPLLP